MKVYYCRPTIVGYGEEEVMRIVKVVDYERGTGCIVYIDYAGKENMVSLQEIISN
jgi:hypothetical protein